MNTYLFRMGSSEGNRVHLLIHAETYDLACRKMRKWADFQLRENNIYYSNFTQGSGMIMNFVDFDIWRQSQDY